MNLGSSELFDLTSILRVGSSDLLDIVTVIAGNGSFNGNTQW